MRALPSLRALDEAAPQRIWLASQPCDMRRGFDRLAEMAREVTGQDPWSGHLFLFRSRRGDRLKILFWDRDGYVLWYKRLEMGVFRLPRPSGGAAVELRASELAMLLEGIDLGRARRLPRYERDEQKDLRKFAI